MNDAGTHGGKLLSYITNVRSTRVRSLLLATRFLVSLLLAGNLLVSNKLLNVVYLASKLKLSTMCAHNLCFTNNAYIHTRDTVKSLGSTAFWGPLSPGVKAPSPLLLVKS